MAPFGTPVVPPVYCRTATSFSGSIDDKVLATGEIIKGAAEGLADASGLRLDRDFTAMVKFTTRGDGALFSLSRPEKWEPDAKMFGVRNGKLFYDIGWLGVVSGKKKGLADGKSHIAAVRSDLGDASNSVSNALIWGWVISSD